MMTNANIAMYRWGACHVEPAEPEAVEFADAGLQRLWHSHP